MRYKKTQVTVFIIIGIVLLFIFVALFSVKNTIQKQSIQKNVEDVTKLFSERGKYHEYVRSCIDRATNEGLMMVGMQGGVIYDYQVEGGKVIPNLINPYGINYIPYEHQGNFYNVSYGIKSPETGGSEYHPDLPFYPYGLTKLTSNPKKDLGPSYTKSFGNYPKNPFVPLCDSNGSTLTAITLTLRLSNSPFKLATRPNSVVQTGV